MKIELAEKRIREIIREEILRKESIQSTINLTSPSNRSYRGSGEWDSGNDLDKYSPSSSNDEDHLNSEFRTKIAELKAALPGWNTAIFTTYRSIPDQRRAMESGASMVEEPYYSLHTSLTDQGVRNSYAIDLWPTAVDRNVTSEDTSRWAVLMQFYSELGQVIQTSFSDDLEWGGSWSTPFAPRYTLVWDGNKPMGWDPGHVQLKGVDLEEMKENTIKGLEYLKARGREDETESTAETHTHHREEEAPAEGEGCDTSVDPLCDVGP